MTVKEGAGGADTDNPAVTVMVRVSGLPAGKTGMDGDPPMPTPRQAAINKLGDLGYVVVNQGGDASEVTVTPEMQDVGELSDELDGSDTIELMLTATEDETNWEDESFTLKITSGEAINTGGTLQGTIEDNEFVPVAEFSRTSVTIAENNSTKISVSIKTLSDVPGAVRTTLVGGDPVVLSVSPVDAIFVLDGDVMGCPTDPTMAPPAPVFVSSDGAAATYDAMKGELTINNVDAFADAAAEVLTLEACDVASFRNSTITLSFKADSLMTDAGDITAGNQLEVVVESDEDVPVVSFFPTDVFIDEGGEHDVVLSASAAGMQNAEVMMAMLRVEHDETDVGLYYKGGDKIEPNADGTLTVKIEDGEGQVRLTAKSYADPDLHAGDMAKKTWRITSADGAEIGEDDWFTVNVAGVGEEDPDTDDPDTDDSGGVGGGDIGIKSVKVDAAKSDNKVDEGTTTTVTVTLTEDWTEATAAEITLVIGVPDGTAGGDKGNAELEASTDGGPVDLLLGSLTLAVNKDQDDVSIALLVNDDLDAVDEKFVITATLTGVEDVTDADKLKGNFSGTIVDDETQTYEFEVKTDDDEIKEDDTFEVTLKAKPNRPAKEDVTIFLRAPKGYKAASSEVVLNAENTLETIMVTTPENDKNRTDDVITLNAVTGSVASNMVVGTSDSITVLDIHQLPTDITGEAKGADEDGKETDAVVTMVAEGGKAFLYVTVVNESGDDDRISDVEDFLVTPTLSGSQVLDARIMPTNMKISDGDESGDETVVGPFTIEAVNDEDIGMEALTVSLDVTGGKDYGPGTSSGTFSINLEDGTEPLVFVKDGAYAAIMAALGGAVAPGATVTIMTGDLFGTAEGYTASFGAAVEGDTVSASASGESFTLTASEDMTGESKVTVTATAQMMGSSFIPSQTVSNVAEIVFPVMVEAAEPVPALPLIAQLLLGLGVMGGGARQLFRRRRQASRAHRS